MDLSEQILAAIIARAAQVFGKDSSQLSATTRFTEDLNAKSANIVQITTMLEDKFEVEVPYMDFRRRRTLGEAAEYIRQLVEG